MPMSFKAVRCLRNAGAHPAALAPPRRTSSHSAARSLLAAGACIAATLLLVVPLLTLEADARGGGGHGGGGHGGGGHGGGGVRSSKAAHIGGARSRGAHIAVHSVRGSRFAGRSARTGGARISGAGTRFTHASTHTLGRAAARAGDPGRRVLGNRAIANMALRSQFGQARFHGGFFGSSWPWWRGGLVIGWVGPLFWPYAYYDL